MTGHSTTEQKKHIELLDERQRAGSATYDELLERSLLALEPEHDGFGAADRLERIDAEYDDSLSKLWLAFTCIYELMDGPALQKAIDTCERLISSAASEEVRAAAWMLKGAARRHLSAEDDVRSDVEQSIRLAPRWIGNHQLLAEVLAESGDRSGAEKQLRQALANVAELPPAQSYEKYMFELLITAQRSAGIAERLRRKLDDY